MADPEVSQFIHKYQDDLIPLALGLVVSGFMILTGTVDDFIRLIQSLYDLMGL